MTKLAIAYTDAPGFPAGSVLSVIAYSVKGRAAGAQALTGQFSPGTIDIDVGTLGADTYDWSITNQDAAGNSFGDPFTGSLELAAPATVTLSLATGLSIETA